MLLICYKVHKDGALGPKHKAQWKLAVLSQGQSLPVACSIPAFLGQQTFTVVTGDDIQDGKQRMGMRMLLPLQLTENFPSGNAVKGLSGYTTHSLQGDGISPSGTMLVTLGNIFA